MERKKVDGIWWRKINGGSVALTIGGKRKKIKPNQKFVAAEEEIPMVFRDSIIRLDGVDMTQSKPEDKNKPIPEEVEKPEYSLKQRSPGWFDIVDANGKVITEKALRKGDAEKAVEDME